MQPEHRHAAGACRRDAAEQVVQMLGRIRQMRQHRRNHHVTLQPGIANGGDQTEPSVGRRGPRLHLAVQLRISDRQGHRDTHVDVARGLGDQRQIAAQQRALGENGEWCARIGQCGNDSGHQGVAPFGTLIGIGVGAEGDRLTRPGPAPYLTRQHLGHVGLHHHLAVEIRAAVEVEILMRRTRKAIPAGVTAPAIAVDRVPERQHRGRGHLVQRRLAQHLVERDALELRRADTADEAEPLQTGQRPVIGTHRLPVPPHAHIEQLFDVDVK